MLCIALLFGGAFGVMAGNAPAGTAVFACLLCMLCLVPLLWVERINDRYALSAVFMLAYYMCCCGVSLNQVLFGSDIPLVLHDEFFTAAQCGELLGAVFVLIGYRLGSALVPRPTADTVETRDWSASAVLTIGLGCWVVGSISLAYYSLVVTPENTVQSTAKGFAAMGPVLTFLVMLGHLIQPLGVAMLAYGYAKNRTPFWLSLVLTLVALQLTLGFIIDQKGFSVLAIIMVALAQSLLESKVPKGWLATVLVFMIFLFPVFQASRIIRGEHGLDRAQALERIGDVFELALDARTKVTEGRHRAQTFGERSSNEEALGPLFDRVGVDVPFLHGRTFVALPYAFIPRLLLPDKEDVAVGQLYNRTFQHGSKDDFTYISVSHLGEFYWNFGWPGLICGMLLTGMILGYTGARTSLAEGRSLTRLLILLVTIEQICFNFNASIAISYVVWMRALAAIGLLHLMFAQPSAGPARPLLQPAAPGPLGGPQPRYPNFL